MKLFWRIFLSFWIATILMIAVVLHTSELWPGSLTADRQAVFHPETAVSELSTAVDVYETKGSDAFLATVRNLESVHTGSIYLLDQNKKTLVQDGPAPPFYATMANQTLESGQAGIRHTGLIRYGYRIVFACPIVSSTGKRYVAVMALFEPKPRLLRLRFWFNLAMAMIPAALVCLVLTFYITRPVTRLRAAAKRLATGDLGARSSSDRIGRGDELGDLARDFDAMAAQIQSLMTAQRRFVADVSHELGAPLTRMHLALALLRRRLVEKDHGELERIERETDKLSNLVQQLLLLAGLEAGSVPAENLTAISMQSLCEDLAEDARFDAEHAGCTISGTRENVLLPAYPHLLRRAIDNVLRNAIRYSPRGSEIFLNCSTEANPHNVVVEVLDSGPGVPPSMLSDIFRPFFRTAHGHQSCSGGTGLGLAIAYEAARLHGGSIVARNRDTGGLQVIITLPLKPCLSEESRTHEASELHPVG